MENRRTNPVNQGRLDEIMTKSIDQGDCNIKVIEGIIVGKRSMGRKLAFADVAILPSQSSLNERNDDKPKDHTMQDEIKSDGASIRIIFLRQSFVGSKKVSSESSRSEIINEDASGVKLDYLDEDFPKKSSSLPFGSTIVAQLGHCQKVLSKTDANVQSVQDVWEVTRWKILDHTRDIALKLASLDNSAGEGGGDYSTSKSAFFENRMKLENTEKTAETTLSEHESQKVIMGSGAMSCSTYLKIRGNAFELANQHKQKYWKKEPQITGMNSEVQSNRGNTSYISQYSSSTTTEERKSGIHLDCHHGGRHAKALRAKIFASWVMETFFGVEPTSNQSGNLQNDQHPIFCHPCNESFSEKHDATNSIGHNFQIIDVAGGKGQLALELILQQMEVLSLACTRHNGENDQTTSIKQFVSRCTIIDPMVRKGDAKLRHVKLKRAKSLLKRFTNQNSNGDKIAQNHPHSLSTNTEESVESEKEIELYDETSFPPITHIATRFSFEDFPSLYSRFIGSTRPNHQNASGQVTSPLHEDQHELINSRLLLLGLHPDECTEDIVDVALKYNLPFAIVPCCVFPDLFPSRQLTSTKKNKTNTETFGQSEKEYLPVRNYSEFLHYLMGKSEKFSMATLPFEGKNIVIYRKFTK